VARLERREKRFGSDLRFSTDSRKTGTSNDRWNHNRHHNAHSGNAEWNQRQCVGILGEAKTLRNNEDEVRRNASHERCVNDLKRPDLGCDLIRGGVGICAR
jgi:hypothetical protein